MKKKMLIMTSLLHCSIIFSMQEAINQQEPSMKNNKLNREISPKVKKELENSFRRWQKRMEKPCSKIMKISGICFGDN